MRKVFFIPFLLLISCAQNNSEELKTDNSEDIPKKDQASFKNFDDRVKHEIREKLSMDANEKFTFEISYEKLNSDDKKDAIITVNRLNYAMDLAAKSTNAAKRAEIGYMGGFNCFFFYDGSKDEISVPIIVASSAKSPLKVFFENIQSDNFKDIIVEYRVHNAIFRNYYQLQQLDLQLVFKWKVFDKLPTGEYQASTFSYAEGTFCLVRDILIHKGKIMNDPVKQPDLFSFQPEIIPTKELEYRFMFDPAKQKYVTNAVPK